jgi:hypothetical protein
MKTTTRSLPVLLAILLVWASPAGAQDKLAQTGMKFLGVEPDPRAAALGGAFTAVEGSSSSAFFNPAGTARIPGFGHVFIGYTQWIADINHLFGAISLSPWGGEYGVLTLSIQAVDYGEIEQTIFYNNSRGYLDLGALRPTSMVLGINYGRALSEKFSIGGGVKYVTQNLGSSLTYLNSSTGAYERSYYETGVWAFDFGMLYKTGFKSLAMGMCIRNFSKEARFVEEGFQLPLTFRFGFAMNVLDLTSIDPKDHSVLMAVDFEHPRDFSEQVKVGLEYLFSQTVAVRVGYVFPADEHGFTYGLGLRQSVDKLGVGVDYAYTPFGVFGGVHRVALTFTM